MAKIIVGNPDYDEEFEKDETLMEFINWVSENIKGFAGNLHDDISARPLCKWIEIFLDWSEYSDYVERHK